MVINIYEVKKSIGDRQSMYSDPGRIIKILNRDFLPEINTIKIDTKEYFILGRTQLDLDENCINMYVYPLE